MTRINLTALVTFLAFASGCELEEKDGYDTGSAEECDDVMKETFYADGDGDGYGTDVNTKDACEAPAGYVAESGDCDDQDASVYPAAEEVSDDGIDQDCDGEDLVTPAVDADGDGYDEDSDCDDNDANIYPGAPELCDGVDNNCDSSGASESGLVTFFDASGNTTDLTDTFAAGTDSAPVAWTGTEDGTLNFCDGTFYTNIRLEANIDIVGQYGTEYLDGADNERVIHNYENDRFSVYNLYIQNGNAARNGGGGVWCDQADVTLTNVAIINNTAETAGGGIASTNCNLTISSTIVSDNSSDEDSGALYFSGGELIIEGSVMNNNTAGTSGGVMTLGGLSSSDGTWASLSYTTMSGNSAEYYGGAIYLQNSDSEAVEVNITESSFSSTSVNYSPAGTIQFSDTSGLASVIGTNITFVNNTSDDVYFSGGNSFNSDGTVGVMECADDSCLIDE